MKNFLLYMISAILIFAAAFGLTEYWMGTSPILEEESANLIYIEKVSAHSKEEIHFRSEEAQALIEILSKAERKNYRVKFTPVWQGDMKYNIDIVDAKHNIQFITLGNVNVVYSDSSKGGYEIINSEEIIVEISELFEK